MKGQTNPIFNVMIVLAIVVVLAIGVTYLLNSKGGEDKHVLSTGSISFSIVGVRDSAVLVRNDGAEPIQKNSLRVLANGAALSYTQESEIKPNSIGELHIDLVKGDCDVRIEVIGSFNLMSTDARLCVYEEEFDTDPAWNTDDTEMEVNEGVATITNTGEVGVAYDDARVKSGLWVLEGRLRGDTPQILFLQTNGIGYVFGVSSRGASITEISFIVGDVKRDSHLYSWAWDTQRWYNFKISSEGRGVYFGKVWEDGLAEPSEWSVFLTDTTYKEGGIGTTMDTAGEKMEIDLLRASIPKLSS